MSFHPNNSCVYSSHRFVVLRHLWTVAGEAPPKKKKKDQSRTHGPGICGRKGIKAL